MASMSSVNWEHVIDDVKIEILDVSVVINDESTLLKALLDESNENEAEDERLGSVIRSLEAEIIIDPKMIGNRSLTPEMGIYENYKDNRSDECSVSCQVENFDWIDMEMEMEMDCTSSPSNDMGNWYMDTFTDEIGSGMVEFGDELRDYSQFYFGVQSEDHAYSSLWQETYDNVMYG